MKAAIKTIIGLAIVGSNLGAQSMGSLSGRIVDRDTQQPLMGASAILLGTDWGAAADREGRFNIADIPVGGYTVQVMMMGYKTQSRANVHIVPLRETVLNMALEAQVLQSEGVTVTAGYFERAQGAVASAMTVDIEEIRSDPVGAYDVIRMMQALPAVAGAGDQTNEIIVRGGGPNENLFVMDHLDIPYPNHFPNQGRGGGPVVAVNTEFVERIDFYAGAFPAQYGDKLSSVMDVSLREGSRNRHLAEFSFNMAGIGLLLEGPLTKQGSYLASYNRSFLDLVIQNIGLTAIPIYSSTQAKFVYDLDARQKLVVNFLGGTDAIKIDGQEEYQAGTPEIVEFASHQALLGLTYKNLLSERGYTIWSISHARTIIDFETYREPQGGERETVYRKDNIESETTLKGDWFFRLSRNLEFSTGLNLKYIALDYKDHSIGDPVIRYAYGLDTLPPDTVSSEVFYLDYYENDSTVALPFDTLEAGEPWTRQEPLTFLKTGVYGQLQWRPAVRLTMTFGGRLEYIGATQAASFSPRVGLKYQFTDRLQFNAAAGRYYQSPYYDQLIGRDNETPELDNFYADQGVVGLEFLARADVRATVELYYKSYDDMVITQAQTTKDSADSFDGWVNAGAGHSYGAELFVQKKFSNKWYGTFSYSKSVAEGIDPRTDDGTPYPWDYDYGDILTLIGGYKIRYMDYDWYQKYKKTFWAKALSWIPVMPADEYEISFRTRYQGGRPYTPQVYNHTVRRWYADEQQLNSERLGHYLRFDIMVLQRFYFTKMNLVAFWDIMNVFDRNNPWDYFYREDGVKEVVWQYKTFPVGGLILEF
ncbi:MAG: TonB-dependent receptor [Candidatus Neomarinimicrobiota bacterium]